VYFEALSLAKSGNVAAAKAAWKRLAARRDSYYGQRAAIQLGLPPAPSRSSVCEADSDRTRQTAIERLRGQRRPLLTDALATTDVLSELMFLELWDEASFWVERTRRPDPALAADLQYVNGRYNRAISYADRLPSSPGTEPLLYPAGYREAICRSAAEHGVDPLWLHAIIWQESKYNADAHSGAAARGLMQFIPDTAQSIAVQAGIEDLTLDRLYDPETSIRLGAYYWATLLSEFKSPELALAAYNGGPDNVRRWRDKWPDSDGEFFVSDIGFTETKLYVQAVFSARAAYGRLN
jgi:soluble lytic murein transglycosylase